MPESDTLLVFKILTVLARESACGRALPLEQISGAMQMRDLQAERYLTMLHQFGVVRAEQSAQHPPSYRLTRYGLQRMAAATAH